MKQRRLANHGLPKLAVSSTHVGSNALKFSSHKLSSNCTFPFETLKYSNDTVQVVKVIATNLPLTLLQNCGEGGGLNKFKSILRKSIRIGKSIKLADLSKCKSIKVNKVQSKTNLLTLCKKNEKLRNTKYGEQINVRIPSGRLRKPRWEKNQKQDSQRYVLYKLILLHGWTDAEGSQTLRIQHRWAARTATVIFYGCAAGTPFQP